MLLFGIILVLGGSALLTYLIAPKEYGIPKSNIYIPTPEVKAPKHR